MRQSHDDAHDCGVDPGVSDLTLMVVCTVLRRRRNDE